MHKTFKLKLVALATASVYCLPTAVMAEEADITTDEIEVISTTPLQGVGLPVDQIPAAVQTVKDEDLEQQKSTTIADFMNNNLTGVSINETQNNPYQPDILFRGFTASPLLGTPQGLSIFQDGVRVNEAFGDAVNWDLIPVNAIAGINLIPGSNPVFGLNTLGGSLSVVTKNGRTHQGGAVEASWGSWQRKNVLAEYGGVSEDGSMDFFIAGNYFDEDGWRDFSPSDVKQLFTKVGWQNDSTRLELSITAADTDLIGNGLIQKEIKDEEGDEAINTRPDQTKNELAFFNLNGSHWFNDDVELAGNTYFRSSNRSTLNGDVNDDFAGVAGTFAGLCLAAPGAADPEGQAEDNCSGALNTSDTEQKSYGFNAQLAFNQDLMGKPNQLIVGGGYDYSTIDFEQGTEFGLVNATRGVDGIGVEGDEAEVELTGKTTSWGVFATDTMSLNDQWALTLSGRYNHINVKNSDKLIPDSSNPASLNGDHDFNRFNPAVGMTFTPSKAVTLYGTYNEGMRAPTSLELGCANPQQPCKLPNALAGDPPLDKVVAKTYELGARGALTKNIRWNAAVYRTVNHDDIQFITTESASSGGYFDNIGKTRRQGLDLGLSGKVSKFSWNAGYSYVNATYQSDLQLANEGNTTAFFDGTNNVIQVRKGDQLANIPEHALKLRLQFQATPNWRIGTTINSFSEVYVRGNENNKHQEGVGTNATVEGEAVEDSGKLSGYTVVNLDTSYTFGNSGWQIFAKAINIFDKDYASGGQLGENWFEDGNFAADNEPSLQLMQGAPRAGWIGARYEFGKK